MLKRFHVSLIADNDILFLDEDFSNVTIYDSDFIVHVRLLPRYNKIEKCKVLKKINQGLMPVAWHLIRWWNWCLLKDEKILKKK